MRKPFAQNFTRETYGFSIAVFCIFLSYALLRYAILKGVSMDHVPLYLNNKAIAVASTALIALSYALGPLARFFPKTMVPRISQRKIYGLLGFGLAALHGLISLLIFSPAYFPKFFQQDGMLNANGELSLLFGVLAFFVFLLCALSSTPLMRGDLTDDQWLNIQRSGYLGLLLILFHVLVMGYEGWLKPAGWPGGMWPMSMVAFIILAAVLILRILVLFFPGKFKK